MIRPTGCAWDPGLETSLRYAACKFSGIPASSYLRMLLVIACMHFLSSMTSQKLSLPIIKTLLSAMTLIVIIFGFVIIPSWVTLKFPILRVTSYVSLPSFGMKTLYFSNESPYLSLTWSINPPASVILSHSSGSLVFCDFCNTCAPNGKSPCCVLTKTVLQVPRLDV